MKFFFVKIMNNLSQYILVDRWQTVGFFEVLLLLEFPKHFDSNKSLSVLLHGTKLSPTGTNFVSNERDEHLEFTTSIQCKTRPTIVRQIRVASKNIKVSIGIKQHCRLFSVYCTAGMSRVRFPPPCHIC